MPAEFSALYMVSLDKEFRRVCAVVDGTADMKLALTVRGVDVCRSFLLHKSLLLSTLGDVQ